MYDMPVVAPLVTLVHIIQVELEGKGLSVSVVVVHPTIPKRCARGTWLNPECNNVLH